jgi:uncharacterized protein YggT (Ycf19 family)
MIGNLEKTRSHADIAQKLHMPTVVERLIWFSTAVLISLLSIRFLLALMGANPDSYFANFIYEATEPLVSPFYGLFSEDKFIIKETRLELNTVAAIAIYTLVAGAISKLLSILRK